MKNIWTIARRDFRAYFTSPIAYILIAGFLLLMGNMFFGALEYYSNMSARFMAMNNGKSPSITDGILRPMFGNMNVIFLFFAPFITMRLFAEERKQQTIQLLMTAPITLAEMVLGKFISSFLLIGVMILSTLAYPIILVITGNPDLGAIVGNYLGTLLLCSCYLSLGVLFSALTENQIVAGALTFAAGLFFWMINWAAQSAGPVWGEILNYLSLIYHFNNFAQGLITSSDVIFYISFTGIGLFLTHRVLDSFRWR